MSDDLLSCVKHDVHFPITSLTTGEYSFCDACQSEVIEKKFAAIREAAIAKYGFVPRYTDANGVVHGSNGETFQLPDVNTAEKTA